MSNDWKLDHCLLIKNNPKLLFFRTTDAKLNNPILRVLTANNIQKESSVYADIILGQTDYFFVKKHRGLKRAIRENDIYEQFPIQMDAYMYLMGGVNEAIEMMIPLLVIISVLVLLYYLISYFLSNAWRVIYSKKISWNEINLRFHFNLFLLTITQC